MPDDREFILDLFQSIRTNLGYVSQRLKSDTEIAFLCVSENRFAIREVPFNLINNKDFILKIITDIELIKKHGPGFLPRVFNTISYNLKNDVDILKIINIQKNTTANIEQKP
jgi:hypothetical protein